MLGGSTMFTQQKSLLKISHMCAQSILAIVPAFNAAICSIELNVVVLYCCKSRMSYVQTCNAKIKHKILRDECKVKAP